MPTLKLTDGTTTIDIGNVSSGSYKLDHNGYRPGLHGLRRENIGGRGIYGEAWDEIHCEISGATAPDAYANLNALVMLLLQAKRFARGEGVSPVKLQYSPDSAGVSSSVAPLQALVLDVGNEEDLSGVTITERFEEAGRNFVIEEVVISLKRSVWILGTDIASSTATNNGAIASVTLGVSADYFSPTDVVFNSHITGRDVQPSFIVVASGASPIQVAGAANTSGFPSGDPRWTYFNNSANQPRTTHVMRYTGSSLGEGIGYAYNTVSVTKGKRYTVLVSVRNNSSSVSFGLRAGLVLGGGGPAVYTDLRTIKPYVGSAAPGYISLGTVVASATIAAAQIVLAATSSDASGAWLDVDLIVLVETDLASIIQAQNLYRSLADGTESTWIENQFLTDLSANIRGQATGYPYTRDGAEVFTIGTAIKCLLLATEATYWKQYSGGTRTNTWTLTRSRVHLTPR